MRLNSAHCPLGRNSVIAVLRDVPDLQDFDNLAAYAVSQRIVAVQHQLSRAFKIAAPSNERMAGQVLGGLPEARGQGLGRLGVILRNVIQYAL